MEAVASQSSGASGSGETPLPPTKPEGLQQTSSAPLPPSRPEGLQQNMGSGGTYAPGGEAKGTLSAESLSKPVGGGESTENFLTSQGIHTGEEAVTDRKPTKPRGKR